MGSTLLERHERLHTGGDMGTPDKGEELIAFRGGESAREFLDRLLGTGTGDAETKNKKTSIIDRSVLQGAHIFKQKEFITFSSPKTDFSVMLMSQNHPWH